MLAVDMHDSDSTDHYQQTAASDSALMKRLVDVERHRPRAVAF